MSRFAVGLGSAVLVLVAATAIVLAQPMKGASPVRAVAGPATYAGALYTDPPRGGAPYVYFRGEAIRIEVRLVNPADVPLHLVLDGTEPSAAFRIRQAGGTSSVAVSFDDRVVSRIATVTREVALAPALTVAAHEELTFAATIATDALEDGLYAIFVEPTARDDEGRSIGPAYFAFEMRTPAADHEPELARRRNPTQPQPVRTLNAEAATLINRTLRDHLSPGNVGLLDGGVVAVLNVTENNFLLTEDAVPAVSGEGLRYRLVTAAQLREEADRTGRPIRYLWIHAPNVSGREASVRFAALQFQPSDHRYIQGYTWMQADYTRAVDGWQFRIVWASSIVN